MLEWAGLGVAMGNAAASVQAAADAVTLPVEEDGAAYALEKYILNVS
jgi:hydroxymethylpyrimidine pyrophosphatase-like HAD family hydrolase